MLREPEHKFLNKQGYIFRLFAVLQIEDIHCKKHVVHSTLYLVYYTCLNQHTKYGVQK